MLTRGRSGKPPALEGPVGRVVVAWGERPKSSLLQCSISNYSIIRITRKTHHVHRLISFLGVSCWAHPPICFMTSSETAPPRPTRSRCVRFSAGRGGASLNADSTGITGLVLKRESILYLFLYALGFRVFDLPVGSPPVGGRVVTEAPTKNFFVGVRLKHQPEGLSLSC